MRIWLNLAWCFFAASALRLHSGKITPLQLIFKIADSDCHQNQAGAILMDSLDNLKCFKDIAHLLSIRTLQFRQYFKQTCSKRFNLGMAKRYGKVVVQRNLALAQMMGMDCISKIENFGTIFPSKPLVGVPVNSWTNVHSFSKRQVKTMLNDLESPREKEDLLFTGFLSFGRVEDEDVAHELFNHARTIFDGPFCEYNNRYSLSMAPIFLGIAIDEEHVISALSFDLNNVSPESYSKLKAHFDDPQVAIDVIARFMQLTAAHIYTSFSARIALSVPIPKLIKDVTLWLADFILLHSRYFGPWTVEIKAAANLAKSIVQMDIFANDFKRDIAKAGYYEEHQFYDLICDMTEQILTVEQISSELVSMATRLKIETLLVLSQFQVSAEIMNRHVKSILRPRLFQGHPQRPQCRHLLVLLWTLSKEKKIYSDTCHLLMEFIMENMLPDSDYFEVFRRLGLLEFLPFYYKQREARKVFTSQFSSKLVDEVIEPLYDSESTYLANLLLIRHDIVDFRAPNFRASNGYLDIKLIRHVLRSQIVSTISQHMVYCGHHYGLPVYIQSLACHVSISSLFLLLLSFSCVLRMKLPFTLHPHFMKLIAKADTREHTKDYLHTSVQYELTEMSQSTIEKKIPKILMLIEQTRHLQTHPDEPTRTLTDYENWLDRLYKYCRTDRSSTEEKVAQLHDGLLTFGLALVSHTVMTTSFESMYMLPGTKVYEDFAILLNQAPHLGPN